MSRVPSPGNKFSPGISADAVAKVPASKSGTSTAAPPEALLVELRKRFNAAPMDHPFIATLYEICLERLENREGGHGR